MHNYGDSGPSGLRPVGIIMPFAFGYALQGVSVFSLCSFCGSESRFHRCQRFRRFQRLNSSAGDSTVWTVRPRATVKKLPSMPGGSVASVMWGQSCRFRYILPLLLEAGTFEPYSLGEFATCALILNPSAKIMGMTAYFRAVLC